ncbi:MAG: cupin domain-containing protein [Cyanobacteria bacterium HKST-UBA03]|nr:cupin domain-containing protein [Cyanobacteria bacterium HKST-UBA03]
MPSPHAGQHTLPALADLIARYQMQPHPEGGWFAETFRDPMVLPKTALPDRFGGDRHASTAIVFLLPKGSCSHLHRIAADELWHFYLGDPIQIVTLADDGTVTETTLGIDILNNQLPQVRVSAGVWFGAYPSPMASVGQVGYTLVGCTVAPGFDFADFELADRTELTAQYPKARPWIERLTPNESPTN